MDVSTSMWDKEKKKKKAKPNTVQVIQSLGRAQREATSCFKYDFKKQLLITKIFNQGCGAVAKLHPTLESF